MRTPSVYFAHPIINKGYNKSTKQRYQTGPPRARQSGIPRSQGGGRRCSTQYRLLRSAEYEQSQSCCWMPTITPTTLGTHCLLFRQSPISLIMPGKPTIIDRMPSLNLFFSAHHGGKVFDRHGHSQTRPRVT